MKVTCLMKQALQEQLQMLEHIDESQIARLAEAICGANRLFVVGRGRSGNVMKMFCMRCMHLGMPSFVVGETVTPGIKENDILLIGSGSGETASLIDMARKAKSLGATVALVTIYDDSSIGKLADHVVVVPGTTKKSEKSDLVHSVQPSGNLFEQMMLLLLDCTVVRLAEVREFDVEDLFDLHANLE